MYKPGCTYWVGYYRKILLPYKMFSEGEASCARVHATNQVCLILYLFTRSLWKFGLTNPPFRIFAAVWRQLWYRKRAVGAGKNPHSKSKTNCISYMCHVAKVNVRLPTCFPCQTTKVVISRSPPATRHRLECFHYWGVCNSHDNRRPWL